MLLLETADVYLVTKDKGFYSGHDFKNGLANALVREAKGKKYEIHVFPELSMLLQSIKTEIRLDERQLVTQFWESNRQSIESILERNAFAVVAPPAVVVDLYITEDPNRLYSEFRISYQCEDLTSDARYDSVLLLKGDCTYIVGNKQFEALRNHGEELSYKTKNGEQKSQRNVVIFADALVSGHKTVEHTVNFQLDD